MKKKIPKKKSSKSFNKIFNSKDYASVGYKSIKEVKDKKNEKVWKSEGYDSPIEHKFHLECFKQGLVIEKQKEILQYRIDFYVEVGDHKLVIELDGSRFHQTNEQITRDVKRQRVLQMMGYTVIRFSGTEIVKRCPQCVRELQDYMRVLNGEEILIDNNPIL